MNIGWYIVYLLMIAANVAMCRAHGYGLSSWQQWVWFGIMVLCFVSGANYR